MQLRRGHPPRKAIVRIVIGLVLLSQGAALFGDLALAEIVDRQPALLIALNPRNRNLTLATNQLDASTYYLVGFLRLIASDPLYYLLGYWYGDRAIAWTERRSRTYGPLIREGKEVFRRLAYPLIFLAPNNVICALSAATGVSLGAFVALNLTGTVARLVLIRQLGAVFESPLEGIVDFIAAYRIPILILSAIAVAWTVYNEFFAENSEMHTLVELGQDDEDEGDGSNDGATEPEAQADDETGSPPDGDPGSRPDYDPPTPRPGKESDDRAS